MNWQAAQEFAEAIIRLAGIAPKWEKDTGKAASDVLGTSNDNNFTEHLDGMNLEMIRIPDQEFALGKFPVTQAQWRVGASLPKVEIDLNPDPSHFKGDDLPVECINWFDAVEFCSRLSRATGREYRLPTEAEWVAARGSNYEPILETGWFWDNADARTHPVGQKKPNVWGLYDMHGNVWEWLEDDDKGYRPLRGGAWLFDHLGACAVSRYVGRPADRNDLIGFRVVCVVRPPSEGLDAVGA